MQSDSVLPNVKHIDEQFPVGVKVQGVRFETDAGDLLRIVVMSGHETSQRSRFHEYHHGNATVLVDSVKSIVLRSGEIDPSDQAIDSFVQGMSAPLDIPQVVSFSQGIWTPTSAKSRLFKTVDPDEQTKRMGLLIEQDELGTLQRVTWYKAWNAPSAFLAIPVELEFQLVTDEQGVPSVDPNLIGGWTWYFSTTLAVGP